MISHLENGPLGPIARKVLAGNRLSREDGISLWLVPDLLAVGLLADHVRREKSGDNAYFINNSHINHTNICRNLCELCAFGKKPDDPEAYTLTLDEITAKAAKVRDQGVTEIHIVGGLNEELPLGYYEEMLRAVKGVLPGVHIQAFDAVEIDFLSQISGYSLEDVLLRLRSAGLGSLPGGGAEIFNPAVRDQVCSKKIGATRWLEVHETAHRLGFRSNATMLYGHRESAADRIDHLLALRELQDRTGGFMSFIPLPFHPKNTALAGMPGPTGVTDLKALAIARLMLDNFDHIKAFWIMITPKVAQVALNFGVDDLDGTVREEHIAHDAGAETAQFQPADAFLRMIREAGRIPVERDTLYNVISRYDSESDRPSPATPCQ